MLKMAAQKSLPRDKSRDPRSFWIGVIAERADGKVVSSRNGAVHSTTMSNYQLLPSSHAEGRVVKKIDKGAVMYVARVLRKDGSFGMAMPCGMCRITIKSHKVSKVYFTIDNDHYGIWYVKKDYYEIVEC